MESLSLKLSKIVGTPSLQNWPWVYTFFPEDEKKKRQRGTLLAVLSLGSIRQTGETAALGREILLRLHEEYYGEEETSPLERLMRAVGKVGQEFASNEQNLEITAAAFIENILYLAIFGLGQAWVKREGILGRVLAGKGKDSVSASGFLGEGDLFLLGTTSFFEALGDGVLRAALESNQPEEAVEFLTPLIHGQESSSRAAALIGKVIAVEVKPEETEPIPVEQASWLGKFVTKVGGKIPRFSLGTIYVRRDEMERKQKRMFLVIAVILILLLVVSLFFGAKIKQESGRQRQFGEIYQETRELLEQGKALTILNPRESRELLLQAQVKLTEIEKLKTELAKTEELKKQIEAALSQVFKEYRLGEVPLFTDLTLITAGGRGDELALVGSVLVVLDRENNRILSIDIKRKSGEVLVGGGTITNVKFLTVWEDSVFVLEEEGLAQITRKNKNIERGKIKKDEEWGEIGAVGTYAGNLYLLDRGKNQIWRYSMAEAGFGTRQKWFGEGVVPGISQAVSFSIDGSIWLLTAEGKILKFTQGAPVVFGVAGLAKAFSQPAVIYTDGETQFLYVLDKGNRRIVVLTKSGEYQAEYLWEGIKDVSDMVVSESEKKVLLLGGSKIYEIGLK